MQPGKMASPKYKKAPDAPKRFKSAFIIFSAEKHKEIKEKLASQGKTEKTTDIAKLVSEAWRELGPEDKEVWEKKARKDKARYEVEKAMYKGPWKVPANKRTPKDPTAPKRPMSAFLAFSNKRRAALKRQHPDATNADLSKMLSKTWKEAPDDLRKKYMDEEAELRAQYKVEMGKWRKKVAEEKKAERKEREAMALQAAENHAQNAARVGAEGFSGADMATMQGGMYGGPYGMGQQGDMSGMGQFNPMMGGPFMNPQLGAATQQQLLQQLLAGQQMNPLMQGRGGAMGMYGQGAGMPGQGFGQGMGSAGGNFGMEGGMGGQGGQMQGYDGQQFQQGMGGQGGGSGGEESYNRANI